MQLICVHLVGNSQATMNVEQKDCPAGLGALDSPFSLWEFIFGSSFCKYDLQIAKHWAFVLSVAMWFLAVAKARVHARLPTQVTQPTTRGLKCHSRSAAINCS